VFRLALAAYSLMLPFPASATAPEPGSPPAPGNGEELISLMRDRYAGKWYKTLTFVQKTTFPDGKIETWYEALELPGKLRIDIAPLDSGKTLLFRNDSLYVFEQKKLKASQPLVHPLMVLGFDVYQAPVAETVRKLRDLKFDLSLAHLHHLTVPECRRPVGPLGVGGELHPHPAVPSGPDPDVQDLHSFQLPAHGSAVIRGVRGRGSPRRRDGDLRQHECRDRDGAMEHQPVPGRERHHQPEPGIHR